MYPVLKYEELTKAIINEGYYVHRQLGSGFLESVYHNALFLRLSKSGMLVVKEAPLCVQFDGHIVGEFAADLVMENKVIVEVKAVEVIYPKHEVQLVNYLKASGIEVGLLVNFGAQFTVKRRVYGG